MTETELQAALDRARQARIWAGSSGLGEETCALSADIEKLVAEVSRLRSILSAAQEKLVESRAQLGAAVGALERIDGGGIDDNCGAIARAALARIRGGA